jgi:hypothetical protein
MKANKTSFNLSILVIVLAIIASTGGLFLKELYNDNDFVKLAWFTNDLITLLVAVPMLAISLWFVSRGSLHWHLVWMGMLGYMAYNFAFYLFGAAFNIFFVVYVLLFSLSAAALILGLSNMDVLYVHQRFSYGPSIKWVSIYLLLIALMLLLAEGGMIVGYLISGVIPETITTTGHPTSVVFALDLSIVVPVSIVSAIMLWLQKPWGIVLGTMMLLKGFTYGLVLCVGTAMLAYSDAYGKWDPLMPFYVVLVLGGFVGCWVLLKNLKEETLK